MAYWWVSQNQTFRAERAGGYLWAPKAGKNGRTFHHWTSMTLIRPGDIVFSYAQQCIGALGVAQSAAYDAPQPVEFGQVWQADGRRIDVRYETISPAVPIAGFIDELVSLMPARHSPITSARKGVQGYLFAVPPRAGHLICSMLSAVHPIDDLVSSAIREATPDVTTREALVQARVGQGIWRQNLLRRWAGRCAVTGLEAPQLLRASHIKPWRDSSNFERLDIHNGLILGAAYDAAFDAGLISFQDDGSILMSPRFPVNDQIAAGISHTARIASSLSGHEAYLAHHRNEILKPV